MENVKTIPGKFSAPNLINICVDRREGGELVGRIYHYYSEQPVMFCNVIELLREMENLFDLLDFPQASTKTRSLKEQEAECSTSEARPEKKISQEDLLKFSGKQGTFFAYVKFRQNSTWQGELYWAEKEQVQEFLNTLDFLKLLDTNLEL